MCLMKSGESGNRFADAIVQKMRESRTITSDRVVTHAVTFVFDAFRYWDPAKLL